MLSYTFQRWQDDVKQRKAHPASNAANYDLTPYEERFETANLNTRIFGASIFGLGASPSTAGQSKPTAKYPRGLLPALRGQGWFSCSGDETEFKICARRLVQHSVTVVLRNLQRHDTLFRQKLVGAKRAPTTNEVQSYERATNQIVTRDSETLVPYERRQVLARAQDYLKSYTSADLSAAQSLTVPNAALARARRHADKIVSGWARRYDVLARHEADFIYGCRPAIRKGVDFEKKLSDLASQHSRFSISHRLYGTPISSSAPAPFHGVLKYWQKHLNRSEQDELGRHLRNLRAKASSIVLRRPASGLGLPNVENVSLDAGLNRLRDRAAHLIGPSSDFGWDGLHEAIARYQRVIDCLFDARRDNFLPADLAEARERCSQEKASVSNLISASPEAVRFVGNMVWRRQP